MRRDEYGHYTFDGNPRWTIAVGSRIEQTAYHEAAHAVFGRRHGRTVYSVSIVPDETTLGRVLYSANPSDFDPRERDKSHFRGSAAGAVSLSDSERLKMSNYVQGFLAGPLAGSRYSGQVPRWGTDRVNAAFVTRVYANWGWQDMRQFLRTELATTAAILRDPDVWDEITILARRLLWEQTVVGY